MGRSGKFLTFDETLEKLKIDETKLKRLVSEGEIRMFREGEVRKFRRWDVENLDLPTAEEEREAVHAAVASEEDEDDLGVLSDEDLVFDDAEYHESCPECASQASSSGVTGRETPVAAPSRELESAQRVHIILLVLFGATTMLIGYALGGGFN